MACRIEGGIRIGRSINSRISGRQTLAFIAEDHHSGGIHIGFVYVAAVEAEFRETGKEGLVRMRSGRFRYLILTLANDPMVAIKAFGLYMSTVSGGRIYL